MPRPLFAALARNPSSCLLALTLATLGAMPLGCGDEPADPFRGRQAGEPGGPGKGDAPPPSSGDPNAPGGYDPEKPTNVGPSHNPTGFAAIAPILDRACTECHHAGTWLDLTTGADAATAAKVVETVTNGTMPPAPRAKLSPGELAKLEAWRTGATPAAEPPTAMVGTSNVTQLLSAAKLATYKAALPKVGWPRLTKILASPSTLFWDKAAIPPAYQDTVGDGAGVPLGARFNDAGKNLIVPEGKKLFSADGKTWAFPFGHTAGTDESPNVTIVNFMSLPEEAGALLPVVYRVETSNVQSLPVRRWNWTFPKGAVLGEIIMIADGASLVTAEIRVRERFETSWSTNIFRPFPTASVLASAIKAKRPSWPTEPTTKALVDSLGDTSKLQPKTVGSPAFSNMVTLEGSVDAELPGFGDDALVRDLLGSTTFVSAYGTPWKKTATTRTWGPTGPASGLSVVPTRFDSGLLEVRERTCTKCHDQGGTFIGDLVDQAILYGDVWGVDRIFSFHPFEPSRIDASGNENRVVRTSLASIVVLYDPAKHPAGTYSFYRPAKP
ncbi:MAG: hypothetical protein JST00_39455 [Deltaproteobacteria bacterium]|nr:hypothetical protein [Deltaproteobacteria bacterium]